MNCLDKYLNEQNEWKDIECQQGALPFNFPAGLKRKQHWVKEMNLDRENNTYCLKAAFPWEIQKQSTKNPEIYNVAKHKFRNKNMDAKLKNRDDEQGFRLRRQNSSFKSWTGLIKLHISHSAIII